MPSQLLAPKDLETRFWLRSVATGGWASLIVGGVGVVYSVAYGEGSNEPGIVLTLGGVMAMGAAALWLVPWDRFARSHMREILILTWSLAIVAAITLMAALDGGAKSPLALALVLPSIFASLAFSRVRVLVVGIAAEAGFGLLCLIGSPGGGTAIVGAVVLGAAITIGARQADFHQEWRRQLAQHSLTDPLTGLLNRRGFAAGRRRIRQLDDDVTPPMTLVLIDLDRFKDYNDLHGHKAGDDLLRWIGTELLATARETDSVARIGGDEFALLLPDTDARAAVPLVERIEERLGRRAPHSLGAASSPEDGTDLEQLYRAADARLYMNKFARGGPHASYGPTQPRRSEIEPTTTRSRPWPFARYIARSTARKQVSASGTSPCSRQRPTLAVQSRSGRRRRSPAAALRRPRAPGRGRCRGGSPRTRRRRSAPRRRARGSARRGRGRPAGSAGRRRRGRRSR